MVGTEDICTFSTFLCFLFVILLNWKATLRDRAIFTKRQGR